MIEKDNQKHQFSSYSELANAGQIILSFSGLHTERFALGEIPIVFEAYFFQRWSERF